MFQNKKIFILGMARSGYEAAKLLSSFSNEIILNDIKEEQNLEHLKELRELGVEVILGSHPDEIFSKDIDFLIKNPGIKNDHKYVLLANEYNIPVINEVEMAYLLMNKNSTLIAVTGSNGKTTTVTLIYEILKASKKDVHLTGNIGFPVSSFVNKIKDNDIVIMEISVQQLCNLDKFKPNIAVLLNLYESHLDFVSSYENYKNLKLRIFKNQDISDSAILNYDDEEVVLLTKDIIPQKIYFSKNKDTNGAYINGDAIYYNGEFIMCLDDLFLKGKHNHENVLAAITVSKRFDISNKKIIEVLKNFKGIEHRIEYVKNLNGRMFYNDSKSTNIAATKTALCSFKDNIILLLGGLDRGQSFEDLREYLGNVKSIVCYGETKGRIKMFCDSINIECKVLETLDEAVKYAYSISNDKDIILFSPACASFDQYKDFEERGTIYKNIVNNL